MRKAFLPIVVLGIIFQISCKKNEPEPFKSGANEPVNSEGDTKTGLEKCGLTAFYDETTGGYAYTFDNNGKITKATKLDSTGRALDEISTYEWTENRITKVIYEERGYSSIYENTYVGEYISQTINTNNKNSLKYINNYKYDDNGDLIYATENQGNLIDSVAYSGYTSGRPAYQDFYAGNISRLVTVSGANEVITLTSTNYKLRYSYRYNYDTSFNRTEILYTIYNSNGSISSTAKTDSISFLPIFTDPRPDLSYIKFGTFANPNPENKDRDKNILFSKSSFSIYSCGDTSILAVPRMISFIKFDSLVLAENKKCYKKFYYKKTDMNNCSKFETKRFFINFTY